MKSSLCIALLALSFVAPLFAEDQEKKEAKEDHRISESASVLKEIIGVPEGIPKDLLNKAVCVVVYPSVKKAAFIVGGEFGSGVMSCKQGNKWGAPIFMQLTKGSAGFQIGAQSVDLVLVVMNERGVEKLLRNKVTLGADASIAAGPVGRSANAATDAQMSAEMLSYSRAKGLFAGIDLSGGALKPDESANAHAYGNASAKDIALGTTPVTIPPQARAFTNALSREVRSTTGVK